MRDAEAPGFCKRSEAGSGIPPKRGMSRRDRGLEWNTGVQRPESLHPVHEKAQPVKAGRNFVRVKGLEPIRLAAPDPKSGLSTNSNTPAGGAKVIIIFEMQGRPSPHDGKSRIRGARDLQRRP